MPKVKLSALVSDIKGKSNGSVFSTNKGGLYFRNNPSGGGRRSAKWDKQKSNLIGVSQMWKALENATQEAWNSAVNDFPTTNAFGETRIPTGYELFVRLNTVQKTYNNALLTSPPAPRTAPTFGVLNVEYPELFQLNPQRFISCFNPLQNNDTNYLNNSDLFDTHDFIQNQSFSFRFLFDPQKNISFGESDFLDIFTALDVDTDGYKIQLVDMGSLAPLVRFSIKKGASSWTLQTQVWPGFFTEAQHIVISLSDIDASSCSIFVNGENLGTDSTVLGAPISGDFTANLYLGDYSGSKLMFVSLSDFRIYNETIIESDALLIYNGYVLDNEKVIFDFTKRDGFYIWSDFPILNQYYFTVENYVPSSPIVQPCSFGLVPLFSVNTENLGDIDFAVNIYATPPISNGRTGRMSNYKLVGSFNWVANTEFPVYRGLRTLFGNIAPNSQIAFYCQVYDKQTGVINPVKALVARKTPRFKAGSDLSTKVN